MAQRRHAQGPAKRVVTDAAERRWAGAPVAALAGSRRVLNVPRDIFDLRDRPYQPILAPLPDAVDHRGRAPVRDQGDEGTCTGFAMAAVVNHLMAARSVPFDASPRFLYENAKRYDEWKGEEYEGSSLRGAMKGLLKHGVAPWSALPYVPRARNRIPRRAMQAAHLRPLGAYFRVSTSSINDMQSALVEVGVVLASGQAHRGWDRPAAPGRKRSAAPARRRAQPGGGGIPPAAELARIAWRRDFVPQGGHAFALVGYTADGFIVQNSWGPDWGSGGFALLSYDDWLVNRMDAWVCQLGVGTVQRAVAAGPAEAERRGRAPDVEDDEIAGHYLAIRNGHYDDNAPFRSSPDDLADLAGNVVAFARRQGTARKPSPVMLYAHGGLVNEKEAAAKTLEFKERFLAAGIYPIHFIWHTGFWETLGDLFLGQERKVAPVAGEERVQGWLKEKLIEAKDDALELFLRLPGRPVWREMKDDALEACHGPGATEADVVAGTAGVGPAFALLDAIRTACGRAGVAISWHLVGHSAGSIFHCRLFEWFARRGVPVRSCSFIAPASSCALFRRTILPQAERLRTFGLHTMADADERDDDCLKAYSKSLLYLVSGSFEDGDNRKLLGLARDVDQDRNGDTRQVDVPTRSWLRANAELDFHRPVRTESTLHGSFDDDPETLAKVLRRIRS